MGAENELSFEDICHAIGKGRIDINSDNAALAIVLKGFESPDADRRRSAALVLREVMPFEKVMPVILAHAEHDDSPGVRSSCISGIWENTRSLDIVKPLISAEITRGNIAGVVSNLFALAAGWPANMPFPFQSILIISLDKHILDGQALLAISEIGQLALPEIIPALERYLNTPHPDGPKVEEFLKQSAMAALQILRGRNE